MPEAFTLGPLLIQTRVMAVIAGLVLSVWLAGSLAARLGLDSAWARRTAEGSALVGLAGARAGYAMLNWSAFAPAPWTILYIWQPGYLPLAGLLGGAVFVIYRLGDRVAPERWRYARAISLGFAIGASGLALVLLTMGRFTETNSVRADDPVADFALVNLEGEVVRFSDLAAKGVVLNFWATWCAPCRREMPLLNAIQAEYGDAGVVIVGISVGESLSVARPFADSIGVSYPIWSDADSAATDVDVTTDVSARFGVVGLPTTVFVTPDGTVESVYVGELNRAVLMERISRIIPSDSS